MPCSVGPRAPRRCGRISPAPPPRIPWALHYVLAPELTLDDNGVHASGTWYLWQPCTRRRRSGEESQAWLAGTYQDTYVKLDGVWRFQTVEVHARWLEAPPSTLPPA